MPTHIKIIVSALTLVVGAIFYYFESQYGQAHVATVGALLSVFMVLAMWIFPEAGDRAKKK
jgi:magnesium-transporting ATPase (P-type)